MKGYINVQYNKNNNNNTCCTNVSIKERNNGNCVLIGGQLVRSSSVHICHAVPASDDRYYERVVFSQLNQSFTFPSLTCWLRRWSSAQFLPCGAPDWTMLFRLCSVNVLNHLTSYYPKIFSVVERLMLVRQPPITVISIILYILEWWCHEDSAGEHRTLGMINESWMLMC